MIPATLLVNLPMAFVLAESVEQICCMNLALTQYDLETRVLKRTELHQNAYNDVPFTEWDHDVRSLPKTCKT